MFAGDGVTPIRGYVQIYDVATGTTYLSNYSDFTGVVHVNVTDSGQGLSVTAYSTNFQLSTTTTVRVTADGQTLDVDLPLPVSVIRGRVFFNDGVTPVQYPEVFVTQTNALGGVETFYAWESNEDG